MNLRKLNINGFCTACWSAAAQVSKDLHRPKKTSRPASKNRDTGVEFDVSTFKHLIHCCASAELYNKSLTQSETGVWSRKSPGPRLTA